MIQKIRKTGRDIFLTIAVSTGAILAGMVAVPQTAQAAVENAGYTCYEFDVCMPGERPCCFEIIENPPGEGRCSTMCA